MIRPGRMASNSPCWWAGPIRDGVVRWPYGAAETAPIDERDVADVAARALYEWAVDHAAAFQTGPLRDLSVSPTQKSGSQFA